jgi:hypothetical protein
VRLPLAALIAVIAGCKGAPARLVAGNADTVVVNNRVPVQLPVRVIDARGNVLDAAGVRYERIGGAPIPVSSTGTATCTQAGDAKVRASLGNVATDIVVHCRPVRSVRGVLMMNLVVGGPAKELSFEAIGLDGQPVFPLAAKISVGDSTIATIEGTRIRALRSGSTDVTIRVGDRSAFASVHVYDRVSSPEHIRPGQHLAVAVRLRDGEMRRWRIPASPEVFFLTMLPLRDGEQMPQVAIVGANCGSEFGANSFFCLAQRDAAVIAYHPKEGAATRESSGTLAIWRQDKP